MNTQESVNFGNEPVIKATLAYTQAAMLITDPNDSDAACNRQFGELFNVNPGLIERLSPNERNRLLVTRTNEAPRVKALFEHAVCAGQLVLSDLIVLNCADQQKIAFHSGPLFDVKGDLIARAHTFLPVPMDSVMASVNPILEGCESRNDAAKNQLTMISAFAKSLAHDLRNILTAFKMGSLPSAGNYAQLNRLAVLSDTLLSLSGEISPELSLVNLESVIDNVFLLFHCQAEQDHVKLVRRHNRSAPYVMADSRRLEQMLTQIMVNSLDALTLSGGEITATIVNQSDSVTLRVQDNGHGIDESVQPRIFDPLYTTRANRCGLGLFAVKRIADEFGAQVTIRSKIGSGTCVIIKFRGVSPSELISNQNDLILKYNLLDQEDSA